MWPRVVGTIAYLILAAPLLAAVSDAPAEQRFLLGLLQAMFWLVVIGSVNWVISRARGKHRPWWHATFSTGPLVIALLLVLASSTGQREAQAREPGTISPMEMPRAGTWGEARAR